MKGGKTKETKTKWAMLTSHCARRSFFINNYLMGTNALTISGHKTEKSFRRYFKLGPEHYALRMANTIFFGLNKRRHKIT